MLLYLSTRTNLILAYKIRILQYSTFEEYNKLNGNILSYVLNLKYMRGDPPKKQELSSGGSALEGQPLAIQASPAR